MAVFHLSDDEREEALREFAAPQSWATLEADAERMRWWQVIREEAGVVMLRHGNDAVVELTREGDRITATRLLEGAEAEAAVRRWAFQPSDGLRREVARAFKSGLRVEDVLAGPFGPRLQRAEIVAPPGTRRFDVERRGVVELALDASGRIARHRWLVCGDALDALLAESEAKRWRYPVATGDAPVPVRTREEALAYVAARRGDVEGEREQGGVLEILARPSEGRRVFRFRIG